MGPLRNQIGNSGTLTIYRVSDVTLSNNYFAGNGTGSNGGASLNRYGVASWCALGGGLPGTRGRSPPLATGRGMM